LLDRQVYDQFIDFVSLEDRLFTLRQPNSFQAYNDPNITDEMAQQSMNTVVDSLFSALVTLVCFRTYQWQRRQSKVIHIVGAAD
jgi:hypothetical protein